MLASLTPREERVLRMRFGIGMNTDHTLEEVGQQFLVTRERIRQIEAKALRKLKHPIFRDFPAALLGRGGLRARPDRIAKRRPGHDRADCRRLARRRRHLADPRGHRHGAATAMLHRARWQRAGAHLRQMNIKQTNELAAMRRASSRVSSLAAARRPGSSSKYPHVEDIAS